MRVIDLRSDTITQPTDEMRKAMAEAEVGDDIYGEDPTVNRLEEMGAEMLGTEASLFTPSGSMSNLIAVLTHCKRGDEVIMGSECHMFWNEVGSASTLAGVQVRTVPDGPQGGIDPHDVETATRSKENIHFPPTGLVCLENTHNRCGGTVLSPDDTKAVVDVAHQNDIPVHLDGARIFNTAVYLEVPVSELVKDVDDCSFCLSKALSAPAGSLLCGSRDFVEHARKWRKMLGGGMRQVGVLAAAGVVALQTMVDRLADDHAHAAHLAGGLPQIPGISLDPDQVQTNIVIFELDQGLGSTQHFISRLAQEGVKVTYPGERRVRMVTHRHIAADDVDEALVRVSKVVAELKAEAKS